MGILHSPFIPGKTRETTTKLVFGSPEQEIHTAAVCSPKDNFCKRLGRIIAAERLLDKLTDVPEFRGRENKENRAKVFLAICPEFSSEWRKG